MATILILGGYGYTGQRLARHLLEQSNARLVLAARHLDKIQAFSEQLCGEFGGERVAAVYADAADPSSLGRALHGVDLILVASPTTHEAGVVARAALDAGADYLDVQLSAHKLAVLQSLAPEIERAGRCFITEAGFHPGLPSALVRYAAAELDQIESATTAGYLNMGKGMPYTEAVDELMELFQHYQAQVFQDGHWTRPGAFEIRKVDFGDAIGVRDCYSMFFEELRALPALYPALKQLGFYIAASHWVVDWVITPIVMAGLKVAPSAALRPMGRLLWWGMQTFPRPPYTVLLKVVASGLKCGQPATVEATVSHPDGYELTAIPVVACLLQYLDGSARQPGLWYMGHLADPFRLLNDMERMGVQVDRRVGTVAAPAGAH